MKKENGSTEYDLKTQHAGNTIETTVIEILESCLDCSCNYLCTLVSYLSFNSSSRLFSWCVFLAITFTCIFVILFFALFFQSEKRARNKWKASKHSSKNLVNWSILLSLIHVQLWMYTLFHTHLFPYEGSCSGFHSQLSSSPSSTLHTSVNSKWIISNKWERCFFIMHLQTYLLFDSPFLIYFSSSCS